MPVITLALIGSGCGSVVQPGMDATVFDAGDDDAHEDDSSVDGLRYQDVALFDGHNAPLVREFAPPNCPCELCYCGVPGAICDPGSGWCCSNALVKDKGCMCGQEPGCSPPAVCCALMGQQDYVCVPTANDCPSYAKDQ